MSFYDPDSTKSSVSWSFLKKFGGAAGVLGALSLVLIATQKV